MTDRNQSTRRGYGPTITWADCPMDNDQAIECPVCGATVAGNDPVRGVCQVGGFIGRPIQDWITRGVTNG